MTNPPMFRYIVTYWPDNEDLVRIYRGPDQDAALIMAKTFIERRPEQEFVAQSREDLQPDIVARWEGRDGYVVVRERSDHAMVH